MIKKNQTELIYVHKQNLFCFPNQLKLDVINQKLNVY
jgi:hypothetical protein